MSQPPLPAPSPSAIDATWTVDQLLLARPSSAAVFNALGVDSCCGGAASLGEAALHARLTPRALLDALDALDARERSRDGSLAGRAGDPA
jgi:regulator of cell morphogenesis and NO signaling